MPADRSAEGHVGPELFLRDFIACSSVMIRRDTLLDAGTFRPELRIAEEYDVFLRLAERGPFGRIAEPLLRLRVHARNASWNFVRGRDENRIVLTDALRRTPRLREQVGRSAVRVRLAGFACSPREAAFLSGSFRKTKVRAALTASAKLILSFFPDLVTDRVLMAAAARRRSTAIAGAD